MEYLCILPFVHLGWQLQLELQTQTSVGGTKLGLPSTCNSPLSLVVAPHNLRPITNMNRLKPGCGPSRLKQPRLWTLDSGFKVLQPPSSPLGLVIFGVE
jgi:hypothetical protein